MNKKIIAVCGPTAVGKTKYAIEIAKNINGEIISCDSMQLYKYMDIGSAKPTTEEQAEVKHYLVDLIDPAEPFSVAKYQKLAKNAITTVFNKGMVPLIAGGTGLYFNSLVYDMDFSAPPADSEYRTALYKFAEEHGAEALHARLKRVDAEAAERIHPNNIKKIVRAIEAAENGNKVKNFANNLKKTKDYDIIMIGLNRNRQELYDRIGQRADLLIEMGLVNEVEKLLAGGLSENDISMKGIGYKEIIGYIHGQYNLDEATDLIKKNTRHLAKHQLTWFRRYEDMKWFNISDYESDDICLEEILRWLQKK